MRSPPALSCSGLPDPLRPARIRVPAPTDFLPHRLRPSDNGDGHEAAAAPPAPDTKNGRDAFRDAPLPLP